MGKTIPVRIAGEVHDKALEAQNDKYKYMDKGSWFSFLIKKGLEKLQEEKKMINFLSIFDGVALVWLKVALKNNNYRELQPYETDLKELEELLHQYFAKRATVIEAKVIEDKKK